MFDTLGSVLAVGALWLVIGLTLSLVMGRRGHNSFGWLVLGTLFGPLAIILAVDARRHDEDLDPEALTGAKLATVGTGPVDVLVGYDGSPESAAVVHFVRALFADRLGRLTVATVVPFGDIREQERLAAEGLRRFAREAGPVPQFEILHGHPSAALREYASDGGFELIAVGTRGAGVAKAVLGSAATELAHGGGKVPVLLVGGR